MSIDRENAYDNNASDLLSAQNMCRYVAQNNITIKHNRETVRPHFYETVSDGVVGP